MLLTMCETDGVKKVVQIAYSMVLLLVCVYLQNLLLTGSARLSSARLSSARLSSARLRGRAARHLAAALN